MKTSLASLSLILFAACGGDPLDPGAGNDPGDGTNTLLVEGRATAEPRINDATANDFDVEFSVDLSLNGQAVASGTVTITSRFATIPLTYVETQNNQGRWEGRGGGYDRVYQLDVVSGADEVRGVIVDGPDVHHITKPTAGASVDSTIANDLTWDREDAADIITFRAEGFDRIEIADTGSYSIAPSSLKAEKDKSRTDTIELRRTNHVTPTGAVGGSNFAVSVQQDLDIVILANPAL
jgi:hypothetical protein